MTTQAQTLEEHEKHCPICYAKKTGLNVYEMLGATALWEATQAHNEALGIRTPNETDTCEECGKEIPVAEFDGHECDPEDIAARAADRREQQMEAMD